MNTKEFNSSLCEEAKRPIVSFSVFKYLHQENCNSTALDISIAQISSIEKNVDGLIIRFEDGTYIEAQYNGSYYRYSKNDKMISRGALQDGFCCHEEKRKGDSLELKVYLVRMPLEQLIAIALDIANDEVFASYDGLVVEVMDGSASRHIREYCHLNVDLSPDNLEWCLITDKYAHQKTLLKVYDTICCVYRFSAFDREIQEIANMSKRRLKQYCDTHYKIIKDDTWIADTDNESFSIWG